MLILRGLTLLPREGLFDLAVAQDRIAWVAPSSERRLASLGGLAMPEGALAFPGLLDSHEHLDFSVYPALGRGPYEDYLAWTRDLRERHEPLARELERVPRALRHQWALARHLLAGFTALVHHGPFAPGLEGAPVRVVQPGRPVHSLALERAWRRPLYDPRTREPVVLHLGEGTSRAAREEPARLLRANVLRRPLVAVHGLTLEPAQARALRALVWCPASNEFLYERTAPVRALAPHVPVLFGADSPVSSPWNLWTHLRLARSLAQLDDASLLRSLTRAPAALWGLPSPVLAAGALADLVVALPATAHGDPWERFFAVDPDALLLVLRAGRPVLHREELALAQPAPFATRVGDAALRCALDVDTLRRELRRYSPRANLFELAPRPREERPLREVVR